MIASVSYANYHFESRESNLENLPKLSLNIADDTLLVEEKIISNQIAAQLHFESAQSIQWQERLRTRFNPTNQTRLINPNPGILAGIRGYMGIRWCMHSNTVYPLPRLLPPSYGFNSN